MWRVFNKTFGFAYSFCGFQKQRKQAKTAPFLSAKQRTPFRLHPPTHFGKIKKSHPYLRFAWLTLPRSGTFVSKDDFLDHHRPEEKEADRRPTTKKCGSPPWRSPCWGLSFAKTSFRSFLFPVFEDVLHRFIDSYT